MTHKVPSTSTHTAEELSQTLQEINEHLSVKRCSCTNTWQPAYSVLLCQVCVKMHVFVSHHNDECSRTYEAPDKVRVQSQPAPTEKEIETERERQTEGETARERHHA